MTGLLLTGARLVSADSDTDGAWVEVRGDRIARVGDRTSGPPEGLPRVDVAGLVLVPGLVDVHQHGGGGGSYGAGPGPAARAAAFHRAQGTTTSVASLVSAPLPDLRRQLADLVPVVEDGLVAGIHLEGPWLNPARRGAHTASALLAPRPEDVGALLTAGSGHLRMVTLAPELPGATDAVGRLTGAGVVVAIGHTDATYAETREALRLGARAGTHLFNAMRPLHHREPGPVAALLESDAVVELVADGVHLHPAVVAGVAGVAGADRTALVTDAVAAAGMPPGRYRLGDREITVADGVVTGPDGEIAGSAGTLAEALRFAVEVAGVPLRTAVTAATATPARLLGLTDVGTVRPGARADLLLLTPELSVAGVLHRGAWVRELPAGGAR